MEEWVLMRIIVDTSVLIAVIGNEPERPALISLTAKTTIVAPRSVHWEVGNALSAMLKRKRISLPLARKAIEAYEQIPLQLAEVDIFQALEVANRFGIYAYDAYIIACAMNHHCPLLTLDKGLFQVAKNAALEVLEVQS